MRFDKDLKALGKCDRTKGCELKVAPWGKLSKALLFGLLLFGDKAAPFLWSQGGPPLNSGSYSLLQGEGGGQRVPSYTCCFSDSFSLRYSIYRGAIFWGSMPWIPSLGILKSLDIISISFLLYEGTEMGIYQFIPISRFCLFFPSLSFFFFFLILA